MKRHLLAALLATTIATPAMAQDYININAGAWDFFEDSEDGGSNNQDAMIGAEYRGDYIWRNLRYNLGALVTDNSSQYYYGGFGYDFYLTDSHNIVFTPNVAVGGYVREDGKDLGSWLEFRSGLELAYQFEDEQRLGVAIHHLSNAGIGDRNPGTETVTVQYSYPLGN